MDVPSRRILSRALLLWTSLALLSALAAALAFALKIGFPISRWLADYYHYLPAVLGIKLGSYLLFRIDRGIWRYAGLRDMLVAGQAVGVSSAMMVLIALVGRLPLVTFPLIIIDFLISLLGLLMARASYRLMRELFAREKGRRRTLIIGAGDAGEAVVREILRQRPMEYQPVALVDDDPGKWGMRIHGVPVRGDLEDLEAIIDDCSPEMILVAISGTSQNQLKPILEKARETGLPVKRTPSLKAILNGKAAISDFRDFTLSDLLPREPIQTSREDVDELLQGKTVLVTGAAGSIGSEICRQILRHHPRRLLLVDHNENALFYIEHELGDLASRSHVQIFPVLCNIRNQEKMESIFLRYSPEVVFHAAAYKHVPVLEHFPEEAVLNNVMGTRSVAENAHRYGVESFVLISTDKAVAPTSVMGTTKRIAELLVGELDRISATRFTTIRFGNVLGSNGSVVQLFRKQIAQGGPVTITHPDICRFFMTIPEAVELVLFAAAMEGEGSTYILDMGKQIRIVDLAHHFIRLCGLEPGRDIPIEIVGLRPGEKLYEELWTEEESPVPTTHPSILSAPRSAEFVPDLKKRLQNLIDWAGEGNRPKVIEHMKALVPRYSGDPVCLREWGEAPGRSVELKLVKSDKAAAEKAGAVH